MDQPVAGQDKLFGTAIVGLIREKGAFNGIFKIQDQSAVAVLSPRNLISFRIRKYWTIFNRNAWF